MKEFFNRVVEENKIYYELINKNASKEEQEEQLRKCDVLMRAIVICGWAKEYREFLGKELGNNERN